MIWKYEPNEEIHLYYIKIFGIISIEEKINRSIIYKNAEFIIRISSLPLNSNDSMDR
jgi:hypothetical protein